MQPDMSLIQLTVRSFTATLLEPMRLQGHQGQRRCIILTCGLIGPHKSFGALVYTKWLHDVSGKLHTSVSLVKGEDGAFQSPIAAPS